MKEGEYLLKIAEYQKRLRAFIRSLHYFNDEVDDILQETNITLLKKRKDFDLSKEFKPWAFGIARWTWMAYKQKRGRASEKLIYSSEDLTPLSIDDLPEVLERERENSRKIQLIKDVSNNFNSLDRSILEMCCDGKQTAEISKELQVCVKRVSSRKTRILQKVKKIIHNEATTI